MENNVETIDLQELFMLLWKNVKFIILVTALVTLAAFLFTKFVMDEQYTSDTYIQINPSQVTNVNDINFSKSIITNYIFQAKSRTVLSSVLNDSELDLNMTLDQLKKLINVTQEGQTNIIKIEVTTNNPQLSADIANKLSFYLVQFIKNDVSVLDVKPFDTAQAPEFPSGPNTMLNTVIGFVLGGMISVGIILLKEFLDRTIRNQKDVEKYLKLPVLGAIPQLDKKFID